MSRQDVITIPPKERNRETGIPAVGAVSWGMHLCFFYGAKQDLLEVLVPYFKAGLENNEFCIWITSEVLSEKEAKKAMTKAVPDFIQYLERGQIEIIPYTEWYLKDGAFNRQRVLNAWIDKLDRATANGYDGMRLTGDTAWLEKRHWRKFTDYEEEVNNVIGKYRMLAICTYSLGRCGAGEIIDVVSKHQSALIKQAGNWVLTRSSERKRAEETLQESEKKYRSLFDNILNGFAYCKILVDENNKPVDFVYLEINDAFEKLTGLRREDVIGKKVTEAIPGTKESHPELFSIYGKVALTGEETQFDIYFKPLGIWLNISVHSPKKGYFIAVFENITERKQAEEVLRESEERNRALLALGARLGEAVAVLQDTEKGRAIHTFVSDEWSIITGYPKKELLDMSWFDLAHPKHRKAIMERYQRRMQGEVILGLFELPIIRKDGTETPVEAISAHTTYKGKHAIVVYIRDITERKEAVGRPLTPLQTRFVKSGLEGFDEREIMELLLSLCPGGIPEQVSEKCLKVFPNIRGLLSATPQELRKAGLSPLFITYLKLLHDIPTEVLREKIMENPVYGSSLQIFDYLYYSMRDLKKEVFKVIYLNNRDQIIDIVNLFEGVTGRLYVHPRKVIEEAIERNTATLLFIHNHPSGDPTPSKIDKRLTRDFVFVGNILQIRVLDHIIIGDNRYFSFADEGLIQQYEDEFLRMEIKRI